MSPIVVGNKKIGPGQPCFIAAEVGINHNGSVDAAIESIDAAAECGADAVKFQNYRTGDFISDRALTYEYVSQGKTVRESQYDMFKRCELPPADFVKLKLHCEKRGVIFFSTPTGEDGVADLIKMGAPLLKNGSDYLVHLPLIRSMAKSGIPTVLSTGMATLAEIDEAVRAFREAGGKDLVLLHCVSSYPTPPEDVNLRKIPALVAAFECPIGFSDHTWGIVAAVGAVALGACFIEKHFTLDKNLPGPDHRFSSDPAELKALVNAVRTMEKNLGRSAIEPSASEVTNRRDARLSCVASRSMQTGEKLTAPEIRFARPGTGYPPEAAPWLEGLTLKRTVKSGHVFNAADFS